ncbi:histidinol dehydrogenase-domain-containing protein [Blastocladiella britannica]|nr:histidinol dehydrogenase-domain-containing protein [Blastocladiella britannica]
MSTLPQLPSLPDLAPLPAIAGANVPTTSRGPTAMILPSVTLPADAAPTAVLKATYALEQLARYAPHGVLVLGGGALPQQLSPTARARTWVEVATADAALAVLDSGAERAILDISAAAASKDSLPAARLVALLTVASVTNCDLRAEYLAAAGAVEGSVSAILLRVTDRSATTLDEPALRDLAAAFGVPAVLQLCNLGRDTQLLGPLELLRVAGVGAAVPADRITYPSDADLVTPVPAGSIAAIDVFTVATGLTTDRYDALFPTLVVSAAGGAALGLVYSSRASLAAAMREGTGVYYSRSRRSLWYKGATSGSVQQLVRINADCDADALQFVVEQEGSGFCHTGAWSCFDAAPFDAAANDTVASPGGGIAALARTLAHRKASAPAGSYTARLFGDAALLKAKLVEEAHELAATDNKADAAAEAADVIYFALAKATAMGASLADIEAMLDARARKITRRKGDAKPQYVEAPPTPAPAPTPAPVVAPSDKPLYKMNTYDLDDIAPASAEYATLLKRPILDSDRISSIVAPIVAAVRDRGDAAVLEYTKKFDRADLDSLVLLPPFAQHYKPESLDPKVKKAIDTAMANVEKFHRAQLNLEPLVVETMPGVVCSRHARAIESVGLYVPGGTAVLPSSTLMLGVPAAVAGCKTIVVATPPRPDGSVAPEVLYVADKIGAAQVVRAGGAQAVAAMAYGTATITKVDKICGPGNQFVTAAKMLCSTDTRAMVAVDMPAGPSEVLVIADSQSNPAFVAADLLSQAEHGPDSQVVLVGVAMDDAAMARVEAEVARQAAALPRHAIVAQCLAKSLIVRVSNLDAAVAFSNAYAPEHLILNLTDMEVARSLVDCVTHAGSVFVGPYTPESCGDYASGTNHTLPCYGYARMYSGVSMATFFKHMTAQEITRDGLERLAECVMTLAKVEGLDAHARAVGVRVGRV